MLRGSSKWGRSRCRNPARGSPSCGRDGRDVRDGPPYSRRGLLLEVPADARSRDRRSRRFGRGGGRGLAVGQRIVADNTVLCGHCPSCRRDQPLFCRNFYSLGVNGPGAFAEFVLVRAEKCFPADDLGLGAAVMTEPTACAIHGMDVLNLRPGSDVLVFGAGPTGLVLAQLLVHGGAARVTVAAPTEFKLALAREYGVDTTVQVDGLIQELRLPLCATARRTATTSSSRRPVPSWSASLFAARPRWRHCPHLRDGRREGHSCRPSLRDIPSRADGEGLLRSDSLLRPCS